MGYRYLYHMGMILIDNVVPRATGEDIDHRRHYSDIHSEDEIYSFSVIFLNLLKPALTPNNSPVVRQ